MGSQPLQLHTVHSGDAQGASDPTLLLAQGSPANQVALGLVAVQARGCHRGPPQCHPAGPQVLQKERRTSNGKDGLCDILSVAHLFHRL